MAMLLQYYRWTQHWLVSLPYSRLNSAQCHIDLVVDCGIICINFFCVLFYILQGGNDTAYVCFIKNGTVAFTGAYLDNDTLTKQNVGDELLLF